MILILKDKYLEADDYMTTIDKISDDQHRARKGQSTLTQLLEQHFLLECLEYRRNVDTVFLDFTKAYDFNDISILLVKLKDIWGW